MSSMNFPKNNIRGFMLDGDYAAIQEICSQFQDREFVSVFEIGTLYGKSAVVFDDCLSNVKHHITTADVCEGWTGPTEQMMNDFGLDDDFRLQVQLNRSTAEEQYREIQENIAGRDISFVRQRWTIDSPWPAYPRPNIVFYDGSHSYTETRDVLNFWYPKMSKGDIIAIDDYSDTQWFDLKKAVDEFCDYHGVEINKYKDSKIISLVIGEYNA